MTAVSPQCTSLPHHAALRPVLAVAAVAAACYLNTLGNGFVLDDVVVVRDNDAVRPPIDLRAIWLRDWWRVDQSDWSERRRDFLYRPLTVSSFALNYVVLGDSPFGFHAVNVAAHALVSVAVWALAVCLFDNRAAALLAGLLFAVHPLHAETVCAIVGRADLLATGLVLGGLLLLHAELRRGGAWRRVGVALLFLAGLLSKESALVFVGLAPLCEWWWRRGGVVGTCARSGAMNRAAPEGSKQSRARQEADSTRIADTATNRFLTGAALIRLLTCVLARERFSVRVVGRRIAQLYGWLAVVLLVYLALRYVACGGVVLPRSGLASELDNPLVAGDRIERLLTPFALLARYLWLMVWPATLSADYSAFVIPLVRTPLDRWALAGMAMVVAAGWSAVRGGGRWRLAILFALCCYVSVSNAGHLIGSIFAERFFYLPSVAACWMLAWMLLAAHRAVTPALRLRTGLGAAVGGLLLTGLAGRTLIRNFEWHDNDLLFAAALRDYPTSARMNLLAGNRAAELGRYDTALNHLHRAIEILPRLAPAYLLLSDVYERLGDANRAREYAEVAAVMMPADRQAHARREAWRAAALGKAGDGSDEALASLQARVANEPDDAAVRHHLGLLLARMGRPVRATEHLRRTVELDPDDLEAAVELGVQLVVLERTAEAVAVLSAVLERDEQQWRAHTVLAMALSAEHRSAEALPHARRATELAPHELQTWVNRAEATAVSGDAAGALSLYRRIAHGLSPGDAYLPMVQARIAELQRAVRER